MSPTTGFGKYARQHENFWRITITTGIEKGYSDENDNYTGQ